MVELFYEGGPLFMTLVSLAGLTAAGLFINVVRKLLQGKQPSAQQLKSIPIAGSTAFMLGILAQAVGLYQAMIAIQAAGDVSPALIVGGFKVSMIAPIYGLIIFVLTLIIYLVLNLMFSPPLETNE